MKKCREMRDFAVLFAPFFIDFGMGTYVFSLLFAFLMAVKHPVSAICPYNELLKNDESSLQENRCF